MQSGDGGPNPKLHMSCWLGEGFECKGFVLEGVLSGDLASRSAGRTFSDTKN